MLAVGVLALAPVALGNIVIGQSIGGVKLGDSKAQVKKVLGSPSSIFHGGFTYPAKVGLRISLNRSGDLGGLIA